MMNRNIAIQTDTYMPPQFVGTLRAIERLDSTPTTPVAARPTAGNILSVIDDVDWQSPPNDDDDPELRT